MAGNSIISALFTGKDQFNTVTKDIESRVNKATVAAIKANQNKLKLAIRANLKGAPRYTQRGKSKIYPQGFQVAGTQGQHHSPRGGGPGSFSGVMLKGVGGVRRPKKNPADGMVIGGVGIGSGRGIMMTNRLKKRKLETKFPYFRPAVEKVEPLMAATFDKAWDKAIKRLGGTIL